MNREGPVHRLGKEKRGICSQESESNESFELLSPSYAMEETSLSIGEPFLQGFAVADLVICEGEKGSIYRFGRLVRVEVNSWLRLTRVTWTLPVHLIQ